MESTQLSTVATADVPAATTARDEPTPDRTAGPTLDEVQRELRELRRRCENLTIAMETNRRIGTAIGIVMAAHRVTDEQAFELLRHLSQSTHRKLRDVAEEILFTGEVPSLPAP